MAEMMPRIRRRRGRRKSDSPAIEQQSQPSKSPFFPSRHRSTLWASSTLAHHVATVILCLSLLLMPATAARVPVKNCLGQRSGLQFVPLHLDAVFDTQNDSHRLKSTVYGNVTGGGSIVNLPPNTENITTLFSTYTVLTYTPFSNNTNFCESVVNGECPVDPVPGLDRNDPDLSRYRAFSRSLDLNSSYAFTTINVNFSINGRLGARVACVTANITPDLGMKLGNLLAYIPLAILIFSGASTVFASILSPWGTSDTFKWTSNYGRDEDLLRLVTPSFSDCLQYIQFIVLTGSLSLDYPGYFQPVVSKVSWSTLMFNTSFVSHGNGAQSLVDGVYTVNGSFGLDRMCQYVGMSAVDDVWAGFMVWLLVIIGAVLVLIQAGFAVRWLHRQITKSDEEDLRAKNLPFSLGNVIRIVFNYFFLPLVSLSMFQFAEASKSPAYVTVLAAILLVILIGFAAWLLRVIATTRPRALLFDDLPKVLLYGPLYNTYSDNAASFALVPMFLNFVRGIAIGAVQPSGVAQIVLLAICEVIFILTLHAFRPFHSPTSMNAYHTFFAIIRLLTTLLGIAFVPSLNLKEAPKGWIGYVILLMHAIALVFGFFLNSLQTFAEVAARHLGAGGEAGNATRGGLGKVFGMRQLSRRMPKRQAGRESAMSRRETLSPEDGRKSAQLNGRQRSLSGSSIKLLGRSGGSDGRMSVGLDSAGAGHHGAGSSHAGMTPSTPGAASTFSAAGQGGIIGLRTMETATPYYRPPRARRPTLEANTPTGRSRGSWNSGDWANRRWSRQSREPGEMLEAEEYYGSGRETPQPSHMGAHQQLSEGNINAPQANTDYAVREVDFYYGVRGRALNTLPTRPRRLGTGPADPTGPVASAAGWVKSLFKGKSKDSGKGFEVVRSSRMPPAMMAAKMTEEGTTDEASMANAHASTNLHINTRGLSAAAASSQGEGVSPLGSHDERENSDLSDGEISENGQLAGVRNSQIDRQAPHLPAIDAGGGIELPSRIGSKASAKPVRSGSDIRNRPSLPLKSARRLSEIEGETAAPASRLSTIGVARSETPAPREGETFNGQGRNHPVKASVASSSRMPFGSQKSSAGVTVLSGGVGSIDTDLEGPLAPEASSGYIDAAQPTSRAPEARRALDVPSASVGYVQQHRASDHVHRMNSAERRQTEQVGSEAEVVQDATGRGILGPGREPLE